ncbi:MAG TPA: Asp-tRNA(Asn)/Glu-tRNA(Gln) amidotransferase subunit GatB [Dehalococcoidia bacterium]|nr:Asp-tRNA(Asn)/Glu-tRNA(Gln) amidotransferase subunit GatB [Dehalococcoidia bacterium]
MKYETIIGLEVHAQLLTKSKMFCGCSTDYASTPPNTHVCPVCMGMPGVLPVINRQAVEYTMMTALALNCSITENTSFDRKNYIYPDLMKGYQISQSYAPIGYNGSLTINVNGQEKKIGIDNIHLEEDTARLLHRSAPGGDYSLVDINRAGTPLMEIVCDPDLRSPEEARQYLMQLRSILQYLGVSTGNMEEGSFRCDANISIRPEGSTELGVKVEVKNMNSFKSVYLAMEYEVQRQTKAANTDKKLVQETRGWVEDRGKTVPQRTKEYAHDYRYFPEPDLPPLVISREWIEEVRAKLPELPEQKRHRFMTEYGLSEYDANFLISSKLVADYFESYMVLEPHKSSPDKSKTAKEIVNWLLGEFSRLLNANNIEINNSKVTPQMLWLLIDMKEQGVISNPIAKEVFEEMFKTGKTADEIISERGLTQISDTRELEKIVSEVINSNAQPVADFKAGKEIALKFLVGQVMRATKGQANPQLVNEVLKKKLAE